MKAVTIDRPYLTISESEQYTGLHRVTLWRARRDGHLRASGYGRAVRFHVKDLDDFMAAHRDGKTQR